MPSRMRTRVAPKVLRRMRPVVIGTFLTVILLAAGSGCAIKLAPDYDRGVVAGLTQVNLALMEFFAGVSDGTTSATYARREPTYNKLIGTLDALRILAGSRPYPPSGVALMLGGGTDPRIAPEDIPTLEEAPSIDAIRLMAETVVKMRSTDRKQGLTALEVAAFKGQIEISMDQALTYESALER